MQTPAQRFKAHRPYDYRSFRIYRIARNLFQVCDWDYEGEYERGFHSSLERATRWIDGCIDG